MNTRHRFSTSVALTALIVSAAAFVSAVGQDEQEWTPPKATEQHKLLQKDVGTWDAVVKVWPMEGAEPVESKGVEKNELLKGGMWIVSRFEGAAGGMPFTGVGTFGYDPIEKKYVGTWVDTMTPHLMVSKGDYDENTKTMTMTGEGRHPDSGEVYESKQISRYVDDDTRVFEFHIPGKDGKHWKMMEITYQRRAE
jgi:hypothetical protein